MATKTTVTFTDPAETSDVLRIANESIRRTLSSSLLPFTGVVRLGMRASIFDPTGTYNINGIPGSPKLFFGLQAGSSENLLGDPGTGNDYNATHFIGVGPHSGNADMSYDQTDEHYGYKASVGDYLVGLRVTNKLLSENTTANSHGDVVLAGENAVTCTCLYVELDFGASSANVGIRTFGLTVGSPGNSPTEADFLSIMSSAKGGLSLSGHTYHTVERTVAWATDYDTDRAAYGDFDTLVVAWNNIGYRFGIANLAVAVIST